MGSVTVKASGKGFRISMVALMKIMPYGVAYTAHVGRNSVSSIGQNQSLMSLLYKFSAKLINVSSTNFKIV